MSVHRAPTGLDVDPASNASSSEAAEYSLARPSWAEVDLGAISHNIALIRSLARPATRMIVPVKANAYGHGAAVVGPHLESLGVDGLATANVDEAVAIRRAGATLPILIYGAQLPGGHGFLLRHGLTPTVYSWESAQELSSLATARGTVVAAHIKVDAGMGRLGVRLDEAAAFTRAVVGLGNLHVEGMYTHMPFSDDAGAAWSQRSLARFTALVRAVEAEHGITIEFAQAAASSVTADGFADDLNTISPGHLTFGLHPRSGLRAEDSGFRKALVALRARLIHVGTRTVGDDILGSPAGGQGTEGRVGVILFGMDNGYRRGPGATDGYMLCRGRRCRALSVSAEYTVIDITDVANAAVGDEVTVIGRDGDEEIALETVAQQLGAPSAAYWLLGLKSVPYRYVET